MSAVEERSVPPSSPSSRGQAFRGAVLRGLGVVLPPLLTVVILLWIAGTIQVHVFQPVTDGLRNVLVKQLADVREERDIQGAGPGVELVTVEGQEYRRLDSGQYVPRYVYDQVRDHLGAEPMPSRGEAVYHRYVEQRYLQPYLVVPVFILVFLLVLYLLGRLLALGVGRFLWSVVERGINRLPLVRNVYSSAKQVTDFVFSEREIQYTRVVAVEYPRKGMWSVGLVTGESLPQFRELIHEPLLAVTLPCSPAPMASRSITVPKKDVVDLNLTVDQALQFIISCGVVVPPNQRTDTKDEGRRTKD
jgi:uncharacterized membrane protein